MKRMLFNATHAEELRIAIVDGQKLIDLDLESANRSEKKGNIYKGKVTKVEPSLEACFVDYGADRQGFLPLKEIYREYFNNYDSRTPMANVSIDSVIKAGQEMIVQVDKDERGTKGAALTTFISLAGRFLVFMPNNPKGGGISRRIAGEERAELKEALVGLNMKDEHSLIARTESIGRSREELQWDLDFLVKLWDTIEQASRDLKAPFLIYRESNLIVRSIRDHLSDEISEIIIDDAEVYERAERFIKQVIPGSLGKLRHYTESVPLFSRYQIEGQISSAFHREVNLPSGGSIAIDHTEALISIDVNSARATKGADIEETALNTNLEAVDEVARQLRVRDLGGLIVIDLIDMVAARNQRAVENRFKEALKADRARVQVGQISRFGLLEMSRQRLRSSISEANYLQCPRCEGSGTIRSVVSSSLNLLRLIEDEALKENTEAIQAVLPLDMAIYLINEKRHELNRLESRLASRIIIIPSDELSSPHFQVKRLRGEELDELAGVASYEQSVEIESREQPATESLKTSKPEQARVELDQVDHAAPPPAKPAPGDATAPATSKDRPRAARPGLLRRIISALTGDARESKPAAREGARKQTRSRRKPSSGRQDGRQDNRDNRGGRPRGRGQDSGQQSRGRRGGQKNSRKPSGRGQDSGRQQAGGRDQGRDSGRDQGRNGSQRKNAGGKGRKPDKRNDAPLGPTATNDLIRERGSTPEAIDPGQGNQVGNQANSPAGNPPANPGGNPGAGKSGGSLKYKPHSVAASMRSGPAEDLPDDIGNRK